MKINPAHLHEHLMGEAHEAGALVEREVLQQYLLPLPILVQLVQNLRTNVVN